LADPSRLISGIHPETALHASRPLRQDDSGGSPSVHRDLQLARRLKANVLIVGTEWLVASLVRSLVSDANPDAVIRCHDGRLQLPQTASRLGTVVFRDVDALTHESQRRLLEWLDSPSNSRQVISTASSPVLPLVRVGAFDDALYYRLNTVYVDLTAEESHRRAF
jgi:Sigma-54 interaction domain